MFKLPTITAICTLNKGQRIVYHDTSFQGNYVQFCDYNGEARRLRESLHRLLDDKRIHLFQKRVDGHLQYIVEAR